MTRKETILVDYEEDPSYILEEEGVYKDINSGDLVIMLDEETSDALAKILGREPDSNNEYVLSNEEFNDIFKTVLDDEVL